MEGTSGKRTTDDIMLIGNILESSGSGCTVLDIMPQLGDAKEFRLAGQVRLLDKQILTTNRAGRFDVVRIPAHVARALKSRLPTPPPPRKGKR